MNVSACDVRDIPMPISNDHNKIGSISRKNNLEQAGSSSSSDDTSSFVALVTASNLKEDTLYLPQDCTRSNDLPRKRCSKIILTDGGDRSWEMDLMFNRTSDRYYITRSWRNFCDENSKKVGSLFTFELMTKGTTLLLSFCPSESTIKYKTLANEGRFLTYKVNIDNINHRRLYLPRRFWRENGLDEPRMVTLMGKDGIRTFANLLWENRKRMYVGKGWKRFSERNELRLGEYFTLECIWENATPILKLSNTKSTSAIRQRIRKVSKASEKEYVSAESSHGQEPERDKSIVILTLDPEDVKACILMLPSQFLKDNGIDKLGKVILLGKNEFEWWWVYLMSQDGFVAVDSHWKYFCQSNGVKIGESFSLKFLYKYETIPVLQFCPYSGK